MSVKRAELSLIEDDKKREKIFEKMKEDILKDLHELRTNDGAEVCIVLTNPFNQKVTVWPSHDVAISMYEDLKEDQKIINGQSKMDAEKDASRFGTK